MPYKTTTQLPDGVKNNLPKHAQEIYKSTFNSALKQHNSEADSENTAHKIAWAAVKQKYVKREGGWSKKEE